MLAKTSTGRRFDTEALARDYRLAFGSQSGANVLLDLAPLCFANKSTYHDDARRQAFNEGARFVWLHINGFLGYTNDQIARLYQNLPILILEEPNG